MQNNEKKIISDPTKDLLPEPVDDSERKDLEKISRPIMKSPSSIKDIIRSEIVQALKERGITLNEFINQIETSNADVVISRDEMNKNLIELGIRPKEDMNDVMHYITITTDDAKKIIQALQNLL